MNAKRAFDLAIAIPALILTSPIMFAVAVWIKLDSYGPVIYRQERIGRDGIPFDILKFRTMTESQASSDLLVTATTNNRITHFGKILRKFKVDELPQFVNVLLGHMSVVGPRPEVQRYVDMYSQRARKIILSVRPGITDSTAIFFRNEGDLLAAADDPEKEYIENILPLKIESYEDYVANQSLMGDLVLIFKTIKSVIAG